MGNKRALQITYTVAMTSERRSAAQEILGLARELLDDIELSRLDAASLLLKATRLARLADANESFRSFLDWEVRGYPSGDLPGQWMAYIGRWTDAARTQGYWIPLAQVDSTMAAFEAELATLRVPDISIDESIHSANPNQYLPARGILQPSPAQAAQNVVTTVTNRASALVAATGTLSGIRSRVLGTIHQFVTSEYHERAFSRMTENVFELYKSRIDPLLAETCADVFERIPSIAERLAEGDTEAISHALTSCRRMIDGFADAVYPPREGTIDLDGEPVELNARNTRARLVAYIRERTDSEHLRKKYRQSLNNLHNRVSAGVHDDVSPAEAQSLFVETYLLLGQLLDLGDVPLHPLPFTEA